MLTLLLLSWVTAEKAQGMHQLPDYQGSYQRRLYNDHLLG